jgi:hypothetical protein
MSNFFKIIISFLITALIAVTLFLLFFINIFNIKSVNFLNLLEIQRYSNEIDDISTIIDDFFVKENSANIDLFIKTFDISKFMADKNKKIDISIELANAKKLIINNPNIKAIKLYDNYSKLIFSTNESEQEIKYQFISFVSKDAIEKKENFYKFKDKKISFIIDAKNANLILKKNIIKKNKSVGVALFYYDINSLNDILRNKNYINLNKSILSNNNIIIIDKPEFIDNEYFYNFTIDSNKIRSVIYKDKYGNNIEKKYHVFSQNLSNCDIIVCRMIDDNLFKFDFRIKAVLFFLAFFILYLLILIILIAMDRARFEKIRGKASLFTAAIVEEIIKARTKKELENILKDIDLKKENALNVITNDSFKIREKDLNLLKGQVSTVFDKIGELLESKLKEYSGTGNLDKVEVLLERFINTIAEKGIQINAPLNITQSTSSNQIENKMKEIKVEEIESLEEADNVEGVEELETVEDAEIAENIEEIGVDYNNDNVNKKSTPIEVEEIETLDDVESIELAEDVGEVVNDIPVEIENKQVKSKIENDSLGKNEQEAVYTDIDELDEEIETYIEDETSVENEDVPKIPSDFYDVSGKTDELAQQIKEITDIKTPLQTILEKIYVELKADKISLLINTKGKTSFLQINQVGNDQLLPEMMVMDETNPLVKHIYEKQRMVFVSDIKKYKTVCDNRAFLKTYSDMKSLFVYPIKFFNKIRAIILIFFKDDRTDYLESIIDSFEKNQAKMKKEISKIL